MEDVRPRSTVTLRPIFTYLMIFDALLSFLTWMFLFLVLNLSGVPESWQLISLPAGVVAGIWLWLRNSVQFTDHDVSVTVFFGPHRIPGTRVTSVSLYDIADDGTNRVTGRRVTVRYHRGAAPRRADAHRLRRVPRLGPPPLPHPEPADPVPAQPQRVRLRPPRPRPWFGRRANQQRETIRAEFAARGYSLPE
jgi:hypothetical protein